MAQGSSLRLLVLFVILGLFAVPSIADSECSSLEGQTAEVDKSGPIPLCQVTNDTDPIPLSNPGDDELTNTANSTQSDEPSIFAQAAAVVNEVSETILGAIDGLINGAH